MTQEITIINQNNGILKKKLLNDETFFYRWQKQMNIAFTQTFPGRLK